MAEAIASMHGKVYRYLVNDHARLDALFERAVARPDTIETSAYAEFRAGLLKHISMEEKILLPKLKGCVAARGFPSPRNFAWTMALLPPFSCLPPHRRLSGLSALSSRLTIQLKRALAVFTSSAKNWRGLKPMRFSVPCAMLLK
jgi:hypothetical protein